MAARKNPAWCTTLAFAPKADATAVKHLIDLLRGWLERLPGIASETETFLQMFLPGRKISSNELALWDVTLYTKDGKASYAAFFFKVTGEYDNPNYSLDEFNHRSDVELQYPIKDNVIDWLNGYIEATNDFV